MNGCQGINGLAGADPGVIIDSKCCLIFDGGVIGRIAGSINGIGDRFGEATGVDDTGFGDEHRFILTSATFIVIFNCNKSNNSG